MYNFNTAPYYDDFDETKNFHRILFKPGGAVQARELTQSQTILQDQISKFGLGIYQDGSKVSGANITIDSNIVTAKLLSNSNISEYVGLFAVGVTSKFICEVKDVDTVNFYIITKPINVGNGSAFSSGETINLYTTKEQALSSLNSTITPKYTSTLKTETTIPSIFATGTYLDDILTMQTVNISVGDEIYISDIDFRATITKIISESSLQINIPLPQDLSNVSSEVTLLCSVNATEFNIDYGVWFTNGFFINNSQDSIVPDSLSVYPSVVVGFEVIETIIDSYDDDSLLDPAIGASNYQAPGADRYKIYLNLVTKPYVNQQTVNNLTTNKFIELARINKGVAENINRTPLFSEISKSIAQSVYDQSGNFIVNPFNLLLGNSSANNINIASFISAGKAYINGYPTEHIAPTPYNVEKSRDYQSDTNIDVVTYYGNYVTANNMQGSVIDFQTGANVSLHNVEYSSASSANQIGTARIRNFKYDTGDTYKVYLFDIQMTSTGSVFANTLSFKATSPTTFGMDNVSDLIDPNYDSLVFPMSQQNIKQVTKVNYVTTRRYSGVTFTSGVGMSISTGSAANEDFLEATTESLRNAYYIVIVDSSNGSYTAGQRIPMSAVTITVTNSSITGGTAQISIGGSYTGTATIFTTVSITSDPRKVKTLVTNSATLVSGNPLNTLIDLGKSDIYKFHGVYELNTKPYLGSWSSITSYTVNQSVLYGNTVYYSTNNSTNKTPDTNTTYWSAATNGAGTDFILDNGQRDAFYDHGYITNKSGVAQGNVVAVFDYFTHSYSTFAGSYFDVGSYNTIGYENVPSFTSQQYGSTINLRDAIDFRPRRTDGIGVTSFDKFELPAPENNCFVDYSYYLSRIDKIVLYPNGLFKTIRGISSYLNPIEPIDQPDALTLFTIKYPAYTYSKDDIVIIPSNLRRYTMRDIGILDKRITNLEYYTSLSILENQVSGQDVYDSTGTQILFKNGFLVDGFKGQGVADVQNPDYAASIDFTDKFARPLFTSTIADYSVDLEQGAFNNSKLNNYLAVNDNIVTFSYDQVPFITQKVASEIININPFNVINFIGEFKLNPSSDIWYDTLSKPIINIVNEDQAAWQAAVGGTGNGSQWNDWNINWTGQNLTDPNDQGQLGRDTQAIQNAITSKGLTGALTGGNIQVSSTTQVLSNAIIPYCRSIPIRFELKGMPPFTELYTFLNGGLVNTYVAPDPGSTDGVWYIDIVDAGSGYSNGDEQSIVTITGNNTVQAVATANVSGGVITAVNITKTGEGYSTVPTISVTGANTTTAILSANTVSGAVGAKLRTNKNGYASGTIYLPNDNLLKIPTGTVFVEFSNEPYISATNGAYASGSFFAQGTLQTLQTTVVSTRPPSFTPKQIVPPNQTVINSSIGTENWTNDAMSPEASTLSYDEIKSRVYAYLVDRSTRPGGITPNQVNRFWNIGGFDSIYTQLQTSFGMNPTVAMIAGFSLKSIQIDAANPGVNASGAITQTLQLIVKTARKTSQNVPLVDANQTKRLLSDKRNVAIARRTCLSGRDPLSQNFYVTSLDYPNGIFLSSVDLFFATKDPSVAVSVRLRPTVNGYPDSETDIPGSIVYMNPDDVNIPLEADQRKSIGPATTFTFDHPIYLAPGEYSVMVSSDSNKYTTYISKKGTVEFGTENTLDSVTYTGSLFKSQNATTWVPSSEGENLCFLLNRCDFAGGVGFFEASAYALTSPLEYDVLQVSTNDLSFSDTDVINYEVDTRVLEGSMVTTSVVPNDNINFPVRKSLSANGDIIIRATMANINRFTSPVIDLQRLKTILVTNLINQNANDGSETLGGFGNGTAVARYITRRVTLNDAFDATDLTVYVDVNRPLGTSIEVYYKVLNKVDQNDFDKQLYVKMNPVFAPGGSVSTTTPTTWTSDTYQTRNITYNDITNNFLYDDFKIFAIKVVMYSTNPALVPELKNFRAIATTS